jgi:DNA-binding XRE family transcriptional regulator
MNKHKFKRLEAAGWKVGDAADFLQLSDEEVEFIEFKLALANKVKELRKKKGLTQVEVARAMGSSQSRIAKLEAADSSVSTDLMLKSFFLLGATRDDIPGLRTPNTRRHKKTA